MGISNNPNYIFHIHTIKAYTTYEVYEFSIPISTNNVHYIAYGLPYLLDHFWKEPANVYDPDSDFSIFHIAFFSPGE